MKYVIGNVWYPYELRFCAVVGLKFSDTDNYFEFYVIGSKKHFRKMVDGNDNVVEVNHTIYDAFYSMMGSA